MNLKPAHLTQETFQNLKGIFLYGSQPNIHGFLQWALEFYLCKPFAQQWVHLEESHFTADSLSYLEQDLFSTSLEKRCLSIDAVSGRNLVFWKDLFAESLDPFIVLHAKGLKKSSPLTTWALAQQDIGVFPCYDTQELPLKRHLFQKTLLAHHINISSGALESLVHTVSCEDWPNFLEKLALLSNDKTPLEDTLKALSSFNTKTQSFTELVITRNQKDIYRTFAQQKDVSACLQDLRYAMSFFSRLLSTQQSLLKGGSLEKTLFSLSPPVFFKDMPLFKQALSLWSEKQIQRALALFSEAEINIKQSQNSFFWFLPIIKAIKK